MSDHYDGLLDHLARQIEDVIAARRAGTLHGAALIDALAEWDATCRAVHESLHAQTERLLVIASVLQGRETT